MGSKKGRLRGSYALLAITVMIGAVVGGAFTYFQFTRAPPECGEPSAPTTPTLSKTYQKTHNNLVYNAVNATFSQGEQVVIIGNDPNTVTFRTSIFFDPSKPHLVGRDCVTDPTAPVSLLLRVAFKVDSSTELLSTQYGGGLAYQEAFTSHNSPQAGVQWYPNDSYIVLLARFEG